MSRVKGRFVPNGRRIGGHKKERQVVKRLLRQWSLAGVSNCHHVLPDCRGGRVEGNTLRIDIDMHEAWHFLFGLMTFSEVAVVLVEMERQVRENPNVVYSFEHFLRHKKSKRFLDREAQCYD